MEFTIDKIIGFLENNTESIFTLLGVLIGGFTNYIYLKQLQKSQKKTESKQLIYSKLFSLSVIYPNWFNQYNVDQLSFAFHQISEKINPNSTSSETVHYYRQKINDVAPSVIRSYQELLEIIALVYMHFKVTPDMDKIIRKIRDFESINVERLYLLKENLATQRIEMKKAQEKLKNIIQEEYMNPMNELLLHLHQQIKK